MSNKANYKARPDPPPVVQVNHRDTVEAAQSRVIAQHLIDDVKALRPSVVPFVPPECVSSEGEAYSRIIKLLVAVAEHLNKEK